MTEIYLQSGIFIVTIGFFLVLWRRNQTQTAQFLSRLSDKIVENTEKKPIETASEQLIDVISRMSALERSMIELQEDCKRYLAKANTRMRRAERAEQNLEEDDSVEVPDDLDAQVSQYLNNSAPQPEKWSLDDIRNVARQRG
jgi:cob(I)alamin adenosyltransferase